MQRRRGGLANRTSAVEQISGRVAQASGTQGPRRGQPSGSTRPSRTSPREAAVEETTATRSKTRTLAEEISDAEDGNSDSSVELKPIDEIGDDGRQSEAPDQSRVTKTPVSTFDRGTTGWQTVRRSRSFDSAIPASRVPVQPVVERIQVVENKFAKLPVQEVRDSVLEAAEKQLTPNQREVLQRRYEAVREPADDVREAGPSSGRKNKGKGPDPKNWGMSGITGEEADVEIQEATLRSFEDARSPRRDMPPHMVRKNTQAGYDPDDEQSDAEKLPKKSKGKAKESKKDSKKDKEPSKSHSKDSKAKEPARSVRYATPEVESSRPTTVGDALRSPFVGRSSRNAALQPINQIGADSALGRLHAREKEESKSKSKKKKKKSRKHKGSSSESSDSPSSPSSSSSYDSDSSTTSSDPSSSESSSSSSSDDGRKKKKKSKKSKKKKSKTYVKPLVQPVPPKPYDGKANLNAYLRFRQEANLYLDFGRVGKKYRVSVISRFLEGKAWHCFEQLASANPKKWRFSEFMDELFNYCFPKDFKSRLREKLRSNSQGAQSVWEYVRQLANLLDTIGIRDERTRVHELWFGFNSDIETQLWLDHLNPEVSSWEEVVDSAEAIENALKSSKRQRSMRPGPSGSNDPPSKGRGSGSSNAKDSKSTSNASQNHREQTQTSNATAGTSQTGSSSNQRSGDSSNRRTNGQQSSNAQASGSKPRGLKLTDQQVKEHIADGLCFKCHQKGHLSRNCPTANVVRSRTNDGRPPGLGAYNLEMGYDDLPLDGEDEVLILDDDVPLNSLFVMDEDDEMADLPDLAAVSESEDSEYDNDAIEMPPLAELLDSEDEVGDGSERYLAFRRSIREALGFESDNLSEHNANSEPGTDSGPGGDDQPDNDEVGSDAAMISRCSSPGSDDDFDDRRFDLEERLARFNQFKRTANELNNDEEEVEIPLRQNPFEPGWMFEHPDKIARTQLGDALSMKAEFVLDSSQPYPGDPVWIAQTRGIAGRFKVDRISEKTYRILDTFHGDVIEVPQFRLEHPTFRVGRWYARFRANELREILVGAYPMQMGPAYIEIAGYLLRDGISQYYPSRYFNDDPEARFNVQVWEAKADTYVINDYDQGTYTLIGGDHLRDPKFNLVRWYQLVLRQERCFHLNTYPISDWKPPIPSDACVHESLDEAFQEASDSEIEIEAYLRRSPSEFEFSSGDEVGKPPIAMGAAVLDDELSEIVVQVLGQGVPYPGDNRRRSRDRFLARKSLEHPGFYEILDTKRDEASYLHVSRLRNPSFNLGLWYATLCAERKGCLPIDSALARWQNGRNPEETVIGRAFERRLEFALQSGEPYPGDEMTFWPEQCPRFLVQRDPDNNEYLLVTDRRSERVLRLESLEAEHPGFDARSWYENKSEHDQFLNILFEDTWVPTEFDVVEKTDAQRFAEAAKEERVWNRALELTRSLLEWSHKNEMSKRERLTEVNSLRAELDLAGLQVPQGSYPALERNSVFPKGGPLLVPKPVVVVCEVNAQPSRALLDSGGLGDFISSTLVDQLKLKKDPLANPLTLHMAVQGSRSKINSTVTVRLKYQTIDEERTFYVINVNNYDLILGTPFLWQHSICLGFNPARVLIGSPKSIPIVKGLETKPVVSSIDFEDPKVVKAREYLKALAKPLCKDVSETELPPLRAINHTVPLIDDSAVYKWRRSTCPEKFREQWREKRDVYLRSGRWEMTTASNTIPMLLIPKPKRDQPELRTVFDLRERNKNTVKLTSPLPDIEGILRRVAKKRYRSKLDLKAAYEQIRIVPEHVHRTATSTPDGNIVSHVIQQGDCNGPATCQTLMNHIFSPHIAVFLDPYLDDIYIYSDELDEHIEHCKTVFEILKREKLYLSESKLEFLCDRMEVLGHIIEGDGIFMDPHKVDCVVNWKTPTNRDALRRFLGAVGYLADDVPGIRVPMGVLSRITGDAVPYRWSFTEQRAFEDVKRLVDEVRDHRRTPLSYEKDAPPIWMITDGSTTGIAGVIAQGHDWKTAKVAAFYSAKLNPAQTSYAVHEIEFLAGLETMLRHQDILLGAKFTWITDHKALEQFLTQPKLSHRQIRWTEKVSSFDFDIKYVEGTENVLADALSRIYQEDQPGTVRARSEYTYHDVVDEDVVVSTEKPEVMPILSGIEAAMVTTRARGRKLAEEAAGEAIGAPVPEATSATLPATSSATRRSGRRKEGGSASKKTVNSPDSVSETPMAGEEPTNQNRRPSELSPRTPSENRGTSQLGNPTPESSAHELDDSFSPLPDTSLVEIISASTGNGGVMFLDGLKPLYSRDTIFRPIIEKPDEFRNFEVHEGLVYLKNQGKSLLCIPKGMVNGRSTREVVISEAHSVLAHLGANKTIDYLRDHVFWKELVSDTKAFCSTCMTCKRNKPDNQRPYGLLNPLQVASIPWDTIGVDFIGPLPESKNRDGSFDSIAVVIDQLTSMVHLIPCRTNYKAKDVAEMMFESIYKLHGLPRKIISDRDVLFTSTFWEHLNRLIGPQLKMSSAYHPQTDGVTERANRTIGQMLRELVNEKQTDWVQKLPLIEFAINSARSDSTGFSPFFLNSGRLPRSMIWNSARASEFPAVRRFAEQRKHALMSAHDSIISNRIKMTRDANGHRRPSPFSKGDLVYLSTKNIKFPKGLARKMIPRYIGPYRITEDFGNQTFRVDLPADLKRRGVHDSFHASLLRVHLPNDDRLFPGRMDSQIRVPDEAEPEWTVDKILSHHGSGETALFEIQWKAGDVTWMSYNEIRDLPALSLYLELMGADDVSRLPFGNGRPPLDPQVHV